MAAVLLDDDPDSKCENNALIREGSETRQGREGEGSRLISYHTEAANHSFTQCPAHVPDMENNGDRTQNVLRLVLIYLILMVLTQLLAVKHRGQ